MSGFATHMLIGAAGGMTLAAVAGGNEWCLEPHCLASMSRGGGLVMGSMVLATLPDIDEPNSWIGQRVKWTTTVVTGIVLAVLAWLVTAALVESDSPPGFLADWLEEMPTWAFYIPVVGAGLLFGMALIGPYLGTLLLATIRSAAGGHRRLTHSFVLGFPLLVLSTLLMIVNQPLIAVVPAAMAWGQFLHIIGDVVTPSGVPLAWPLSKKDVHILPKTLRPTGEMIIGFAAAVWCVAMGAWIGLQIYQGWQI